MIITKEQQEQAVINYRKGGKTFDECISFSEGMEAMVSLWIKNLKNDILKIE
jgi:hypothetical protein